jgi:hypothetical protein
VRVPGAFLVAVAAVAAVAGAGLWYVRSADDGAERTTEKPVSAIVQDTSALAPQGVRVRVRVLNGTATAGLARRGTQRLRDYGYDVVDYSTAPKPSTETVVEVVAEARDWGTRIVRALGAGTVRERSEPFPHADVVVTLGSDWKPPAQPFRP